ncbi:MAG TPA: polymer-forming cytoskeletal protein [Pyrinomonadaceae bacterium]|jgi:cytoskeletal protein CcmA (bactofilin family)
MVNSGYGNSNEADQNSGFQERNTENQNSLDATQENVVSNGTQPRAISESEEMARDIREGRLSALVGSSSVFVGELNFIAMARIDGHLTGKVTSEKGTLIIGSDGVVDANVSVGTAIINGEVNGDIIATEHLELRRTAKVVGNIQTPRLIMADGAVLEGNCSMLKLKENAENHNAKPGASMAPVSTNVVKSTPFLPRENKIGSNPPTEKKSFEAVGKDGESSNLTLDVA